MHSLNFFSPFISGVFAILTILTGVFLKENYAKKLGIIVSIIAVVATFIPFQMRLAQGVLNEVSQSLLFLGLCIQILIAINTISSIIIIANDSRRAVSRFESYPLLVLNFSGMLFTAFSESIIGIYLGLETISVCGYILASLNNSSEASNEASVKYFLIGAISSALMIYGLSIIYGYSGGNFNLNEVANHFLEENKLALTIGFLLFAFGIFFKTTTFPFHVWASDVYYGMNTAALSFISLAPKIIAFFVLFKISIFLISTVNFAAQAFMIVCGTLSGLSMMLGALAGLQQNPIKKILAYSGIVHMGFVLSIFSVSPNFASAGSIIYYFLVYTFINIGTFSVLSALQKTVFYDGTLNSIKGLYKSHPFLAFSLAVLMFSSAGIPPLSGFFIKYAILANLIKNGNYILPIIGIIASVIASFYYLRVIKTIYFMEPEGKNLENIPSKCHLSIKLLIFIAIFINLTFIYI